MAQKKLKKMGGDKLDGSGFPDALVKELKKFSDRNYIALGDNAFCALCESCLKAHALRTAEKLRLNEEVLGKINKLFNCNAGHNGYYLDKTKLIHL